MKTNFIVLCLMLALAGAISAQNTILAGGDPPLTQDIVSKLESVYQSVLNIRFNMSQRTRFQQGMIEYWARRNEAGIANSLSNLKYYGQPDELASLATEQNQQVLIESFRRDVESTNDPISAVLVEAFDNAHPDRRAATRARTFNDLIGNWKRTEGLLAARNSYDNGQIGSGFTDSGTLEIKADGTYKLLKVHNHYGSGCSRLDGSSEYGSVATRNLDLVFQVKSGSSEARDGCLGIDQRQVIKPHIETFVWSIRPSADEPASILLCLNSKEGTASCFEKQ